MNNRECYNAILRFQKADYIPNMDFGPINSELISEWKEQGMPVDAEFSSYFKLSGVEDMRYIDYDPIPGVPDQGVVEEDDDHHRHRAQHVGLIVVSRLEVVGESERSEFAGGSAEPPGEQCPGGKDAEGDADHRPEFAEAESVGGAG